MEQDWRAWNVVKINGVYADRKKYEPRGTEKNKHPVCISCKVMKGTFHKLGCKSEKSPCGNHKFLVDCDCNYLQDEAV